MVPQPTSVLTTPTARNLITVLSNSCVFMAIFVGLRYDVNGAVLSFQISLGEILPQYSDTEQLNAAHEHNHTRQGGPTAYGVSQQQGLHDDDYDHKKHDQAEQNSRNRRNCQWGGRKSHNTLQRIFEQFPERPLGLSGHPLHIFVGQPFGPKPYPAKNALVLIHIKRNRSITSLR